MRLNILELRTQFIKGKAVARIHSLSVLILRKYREVLGKYLIFEIYKLHDQQGDQFKMPQCDCNL